MLSDESEIPFVMESVISSEKCTGAHFLTPGKHTVRENAVGENKDHKLRPLGIKHAKSFIPTRSSRQHETIRSSAEKLKTGFDRLK